MSLNKLTDIDVKKEWMNINCNEIKATNITIDNVDVDDLTADNLTVNLTTTLNGDVNIKGNIFPDANTTAGYKLENVDGLGTLAWTVDSGPAGDITFNGTPPVQINELTVYNSADGQAVKESGVLISDVALKTELNDKVNKSGDTMSGDLDMGSNNILNGGLVASLRGKINNTSSNLLFAVGESGILNEQGVSRIYQQSVLGSVQGNFEGISQEGGNVANVFLNNKYLVRNVAGGDWQTAVLHDSISIDSVYTQPRIDTRCYIERNPQSESFTLGSSGNQYMILDSTGIDARNRDVSNIKDLVASGVVDLRGNLLPTNSAVAGSVLVNQDGVGGCAWQVPTAGPAISQGTYTPAITFSPSGSINNQKISCYQKINGFVEFSGSMNIVLPAGGNFQEITIPLPPSTSNPTNQNFSASAVGSSGNVGESSVVNFDAVMNASNLVLYIIRSDGIAFASPAKNTVLNWRCQFLSTV